MSMGCQWSTTIALTKTQLQYWQDTSWHWQPLSSEGQWKLYPSPQPFPALLLPQPPLKTLPPHTRAHCRHFAPTYDEQLRGGCWCLHFAGKHRQER